MKTRIHNEWFRSVSLGRRKSCPNCGQILLPGESIWSWGEYHNAKWRTVTHFCKQCFQSSVQNRLISHREECGCDFSLIGYGGERLPEWLIVPAHRMQCTWNGVSEKDLALAPVRVR